MLIVCLGAIIFNFDLLFVAFAAIATVIFGYTTLFLEHIIKPRHEDLKDGETHKKLEIVLNYLSKQIKEEKRKGKLIELQHKKDTVEIFKGDLVDEKFAYPKAVGAFILNVLMFLFVATFAFAIIFIIKSNPDTLITALALIVAGFLNLLVSIIAGSSLLKIVRMHYLTQKYINPEANLEKVANKVVEYYKL